MKYFLNERCENCFEETVYETPWGSFCGSCGFGLSRLEMTIDDAWKLRERKFQDSLIKQVCIQCRRGWAYPTGEHLHDDKNRVGHWFKHDNCSDFIGVWVSHSSKPKANQDEC